MPKKRWRLRNAQTSGGRSRRTCVMSQSSSIRQSLLDRTVEKRLLLGGELGRRHGEQTLPARPAAEELAFPPDGARLERLPFGGGHRRHDLLKARIQPVADEAAAQRGNPESHGESEEEQPRNDQGKRECARDERRDDEQGGEERNPHAERRVQIRENPRSDERGRPVEVSHADAPFIPSKWPCRPPHAQF